ncbi:MAG: MmcQ/YjbR family DNA-binding protein [Devosia sp.]
MAGKTSRAPNLFERAAFEAFVLTLPAATLVRQWGDSSVGKVGGKIFAVFGDAAGGAGLSFKCSDLAFAMLPELQGIRPAPYLARAKWVAVEAGCELSGAELTAYVREAHRLVSAKLTRRLQAELGLAPAATAPREKPSARRRAR